MSLRQSGITCLTPVLLGLAAFSAAGAQGRQTTAVAHPALTLDALDADGHAALTLDALDADGHAAQLEALRSRLDDRASLLRVQTVQTIDASPAMDGEMANGLLADALADRDPLVAEAALGALVRRGDDLPESVRATDLDRFSGETKELVEVRLNQQGHDRTALHDLMLHGDAQVQQAAFEALAGNGAEDAAEAVQALKAEFADQTSLYRLQTLALLLSSPYAGEAAGLAPLLEAAREDADPLVRAMAVKAQLPALQSPSER